MHVKMWCVMVGCAFSFFFLLTPRSDTSSCSGAEHAEHRYWLAKTAFSKAEDGKVNSTRHQPQPQLPEVEVEVEIVSLLGGRTVANAERRPGGPQLRRPDTCSARDP